MGEKRIQKACLHGSRLRRWRPYIRFTLLILRSGHDTVQEGGMGTVGLEPTISSARGWQSTKLTYVPKLGINHDNMNYLNNGADHLDDVILFKFRTGFSNTCI